MKENIPPEIYNPSIEQIAEDAIKVSKYRVSIIDDLFKNGKLDTSSTYNKQTSDSLNKICERLVFYETTLTEHSRYVRERELREAELIKFRKKKLLFILEGFLIYAFIDRYSKHFHPVREFLSDFSFLFSVGALILFIPVLIDLWPKKLDINVKNK